MSSRLLLLHNQFPAHVPKRISRPCLCLASAKASVSLLQPMTFAVRPRPPRRAPSRRFRRRRRAAAPSRQMRCGRSPIRIGGRQRASSRRGAGAHVRSPSVLVVKTSLHPSRKLLERWRAAEEAANRGASCRPWPAFDFDKWGSESSRPLRCMHNFSPAGHVSV